MESSTRLVISSDEILETVYPEFDWILPHIIRTGRRRPAVIAAKRGVGKSTVSLELAVAATQGDKFLGREVKRCGVLFFQCEEEIADIQASLRKLGYNPKMDEKLLVFAGGMKEYTLATLCKALDDNPDVRLCIIESLPRLLRMDDLNKNSDALRVFDSFDSATAPYRSRCAFVMLHKLKKSASDSSSDGLLGASEIGGQCDSLIILRQHPDGRRIISAECRIGENIEPSFLNFDKSTGRSTLGLTLSQDKEVHKDQTRDRIKAQIIDFFANHPHTNFELDCLPTLHGNSRQCWAIHKELVRTRVLIQTGTGKKNDPFLCTVRDEAIPIDLAA